MKDTVKVPDLVAELFEAHPEILNLSTSEGHFTRLDNGELFGISSKLWSAPGATPSEKQQ